VAIVVAGSPPARSSASIPNAGSFRRDRASSALPSSRQGRRGQPAIEQESGGVWGSRTSLSIHARWRHPPRLGQRKIISCTSRIIFLSQNTVTGQLDKLFSAGRPAAELMQRRFDEVDAAFAFEEGEGDCTLAFWRRAHRNYFGRQGTFAPDMLLYCERFRLVARIDPEGLSRT
jgi:ASCH domain